MTYLQSCLLLKKYFFEFLDRDDCLSDVSRYIIRTFAQMRGKDITRRIVGQKNRSLSLHTQQKVAAISNCKTYKNINKKNVGNNNEIEISGEDDVDNNKTTDCGKLSEIEISDDEADDESIDSD